MSSLYRNLKFKSTGDSGKQTQLEVMNGEVNSSLLA